MSFIQKLIGLFVVAISILVWGYFDRWESLSELFKIAVPPVEQVARPTEVSVEQPSIAVEPKSDEEIFVCRAAIAELMGRNLGTVKGMRRADGSVGTRYRRPSDGTEWQNVCKVDGKKIIWATVETNGVVGRWRTHPDDEEVTYEFEIGKVRIIQLFSDGSRQSTPYFRDTQ